MLLDNILNEEGKMIPYLESDLDTHIFYELEESKNIGMVNELELQGMLKLSENFNIPLQENAIKNAWEKFKKWIKSIIQKIKSWFKSSYVKGTSDLKDLANGDYVIDDKKHKVRYEAHSWKADANIIPPDVGMIGDKVYKIGQMLLNINDILKSPNTLENEVDSLNARMTRYTNPVIESIANNIFFKSSPNSTTILTNSESDVKAAKTAIKDYLKNTDRYKPEIDTLEKLQQSIKLLENQTDEVSQIILMASKCIVNAVSISNQILVKCHALEKQMIGEYKSFLEQIPRNKD